MFGSMYPQTTYHVNRGCPGERIRQTTYHVGNTGPICLGAGDLASGVLFVLFHLVMVYVRFMNVVLISKINTVT